MAINPYQDQNIDELLILLETAEPGSVRHEQLKMTITHKLSQGLETSIVHHKNALEQMSASSDKLGRKIYYLNLILVGASIAGSLIAYFELFD